MAMQSFRKFIAAAASVVVGGASFALSFVALRDVSVSLEAVPPSLGWLVPIVIDGGVICGSAIIWSLSHEQRRRPVFPFLFVGTLVIVSVVVNAAHAGPSPLAKLIAALPPLILLGTLELVAAQGRRLSLPAPAVAEVAHVSYEPVTVDNRPHVNTTDFTAGVEGPIETITPAPNYLKVEPLPVSTYVENVEEEFDSELESAVEEALGASSGWSAPEGGTYTRPAAGNPSTGRRKAARVRAEGPTF